MKFSVLALDYDGTIARDNAIDPSVREAIGAARTSGVIVILVTGRILDELRRVVGDLHFVDGVVAENGAVVHFPDSGHTSVLAPPVSQRYLAELRKRRVAFQAGQCLVDGDAQDGGRLVEIIRGLELPLVLLFNRSRVMTLPQGVSKATGLHAALDMIRRSARNMLAIGDAENDHEMLRIAEVGAAVEWGSPALRSVADLVVTGSGPSAVARFVAPLAASGSLPQPPRARRRLLLGYTEDGHEFSLAVRGRNVLVAGDAKSGKSWLAGLLCEQLILLGYCVCVLDPEGDYRALEALPGVLVLGGEDPPPTPRELLRALRYPDRSVVIDLSRLPQDEKVEYIRAALPALNEMRRRTGLPHRIVVDEAHYFLHDAGAHHLLDLERNGYTVVTYCASRLPPELLAATEVMLVTCESNPAEVDALCRRCAACHHVDAAKWRTMLGHLQLGQAIALPITEEAAGERRLFTIGARLTPHVRHREKYVDVPVTDPRAFLFTADGSTPRRARTLREFVDAIEGLPTADVDGYLRRGDFSRWIGDVFGDRALADELRAHEERYRRTGAVEQVPEIAAAIRARYDLTDSDAIDAVAAPAAPGADDAGSRRVA
jgi:hydroxymethylpyrimidine pyrophosphatase-like HAD family hydrolase